MDGWHENLLFVAESKLSMCLFALLSISMKYVDFFSNAHRHIDTPAELMFIQTIEATLFGA